MKFDDEIRLVPHVNAPLVGLVDANAMFLEAINLIGQNTTHWNADDVSLVRQISLSNLFFFLKYVAGFSGPYAQLRDDLHMEMCNWRQDALEPGSWSAGFVPRSTYKSSTWTHGATAWELTRNPDLRVGIFSCILDRSLEFMHTVQRTFDSNDLFAFLFPAHVATKSARDTRWNDSLAIMPNRSRNFPEPSLKPHTAGGSTQGIHVDLAVFDDIVGDSQLNAARQATAEMERISNWFSASLRTLLISQARSRVTLAATRYSIDDPYERIMSDARTHDGDWHALETYYPRPNERGRWRVYYRSAICDEQSIFPESYSVEFLQRLAKDDHWTYVTQYLNNPHSTGTLDFASYDLRRAMVLFEDDDIKIRYRTAQGADLEYSIDECDVVLGADPAASEKRVSARTSRSATCVVARTPHDDVVIVSANRDYVKPTRFHDWLFKENIKWRRKVRQFRVEGQGPFKIIKDVLEEEQKRRGDYFYLVMVPAMGDKVMTIRTILEPFLKRDALYVVDEAMPLVRLEYDIFPSSALDLLDALKIAVAGTRLPDGAWARDDDDEDEPRSGWGTRRVGVTGY